MSQQLDDLSPDAARILRIWRRSRPHAVMALRKSGKLRERLEAVAAAPETGTGDDPSARTRPAVG